MTEKELAEWVQRFRPEDYPENWRRVAEWDVMAPALVAELRKLRAALERAQWGACEPCGEKGVCPECRGRDPAEFASDDEAGHRPGCQIAAALG
jgi:hypothetical protein